jgi:hypothetical protein
VWALVAAYAGATALPPPPDRWRDALPGQAFAVLAVTWFVVLAFLRAGRTRPRLAYPALFDAAWDHALALVVASVFTGAGWLVLALWAGLFDVIGITLFREVFFNVHFAHPATGLFFGLGLVLGRSEAGVVRALLRLCLTAGTVLLPLIALVGLSFAAALAFTGVEDLWATRRAAALLVTLVLGTVALTNAVFQDGTRALPPYPRWLRAVVSAALAAAPLFAVLAAWALTLRVRQYGWTLDRLYGALVIGVSGAYALGYAAALVRRRGPWLGLAAPVNVAVAALATAALLASIAPGTDFRAHAARAQLARALADPEHADVDYLRWDLGQAGIRALRQLADAPAMTAHPDVRTEIQAALTREQRWGSPGDESVLGESQFAVFPPGRELPAGLLAKVDRGGAGQTGQCSPRRCALLAVDLDGDGSDEWAVLAGQPVYVTPMVLGRVDGAWKYIGTVADYPRPGADKYAALLDALRAGDFGTAPPRFKDLRIGEHRYPVRATAD